MEKRRVLRNAKINSGSMADVAFLLLIFFLVTTTIQTNQGLSLKLPPDQPPSEKQVNERNLFKVLINSRNEILIEDQQFASFAALKQDAKSFVLNKGKNPESSDSPETAIISLKVNRGTKYETFIHVLDALQGAYYEIYGERLGISAEEFRKLDTSIPSERKKYLDARSGIPMNISIAEPTKTNAYGTL